MAVRRKPAGPANVHEFIQSGAPDQSPLQQSEQVTAQPVKLRVPPDLLAQIDAAVARRRPAPSRHQWIIEAIYQKLERDSVC